MHTKTYSIHVPVLKESVLELLNPQPGESYIDMTAGYGGHAQAVLDVTNAPEAIVLVDRDSDAVAYLQELVGRGATLMHQDFLSASKQLIAQDKRYDMILADLGVSSLHFDRQDRGFSFRHNGPLDMRMDQRQGKTAADIVNESSEAELIHILKMYGEEPRARNIAAAIVAARPLETTSQLADVVASVVRQRGRIHPATRTFQALRIAVNEELTMLEQALPLWLELLAPGGRLGIISFHSLEDRIVKRAFSSIAGDRYDAPYQLVTKKPVAANDTELVSNPRARSAKLRVVANKNTKRKG